MTALTHNLNRDCVNSLGIPVDKLTLTDTVNRIVGMAKNRDGKPRLVSTLNVDFLVNSLGAGFSRARHPELLSVLRDSDLVTADGFPIIWLSRIVGNPLQQRVCGSDLVPELAARAEQENLSIFFLGGGEGVAQAAADTLAKKHPGLCIAGTAAPFIHTEGPQLAQCFEDDEAIVERINSSGADILLVGLGNPKQELWFNRNRSNLTVPVSIGVGGTFEFITGTVKRAPEWAQRMNIEWLFRITQDPGRLWRRYALGMFKLALLSTPLMYSRVGQAIAFAGRRPDKEDSLRWRSIWSARDQSLSVLALPRLVSRDYLRAVVAGLVDEPGKTTLRLLDFSAVKKVEMAGHHTLFALAELQQQEDSNIHLLGISERLRRDLGASRVLDILQTAEGDTLATIGGANGEAAGRFSCHSYVMSDSTLIYLGGKVTGKNLQDMGFIECLGHTVRDRDCIIDMRKVSLLESSAIVALEPFLSQGNNTGSRVMFCGASPNVRQMFRMARLGEPAHFINDRELLSIICKGGSRHG